MSRTSLMTKGNNYPFGSTQGGRGTSGVDYRFGFNGKEELSNLSLDNYNFGARMYNSRIGRWWSVDALEGIYTNISPYVYSMNTPIQSFDPDGNLVIFVNGLTNFFGAPVGPTGPLAVYWGPFIQTELISLLEPTAFGGRNVDNISKFTALNLVENYPHKMYVNGELRNGSIFSNMSVAAERIVSGYTYAQQNYDEIISMYQEELKLNPDAKLDIVTHSQGAAFGEGMAKYINERGEYKVNRIIHLQPQGAQPISKYLGREESYNSVEQRIEFHTKEAPVVNKLGWTMNPYANSKIIESSIESNGTWQVKYDVTQYDYLRLSRDGHYRDEKSSYSINYSFGKNAPYTFGTAHSARYPQARRADVITDAIKTVLHGK